ncbi:MAG: Fic family protein [Sediminicola sp.]
MKYNWQQKDWPNFRYDIIGIEDMLFQFAERTGRISGFLEGLPKEMQTEAMINIMVYEAIKTSEIEGEYLSRKDVVSSIRRNLNLHADLPIINDKRVEGISELMIAVRNTFSEPLNEETLFSWHTMLMKGSKGIEAGVWRTHQEPMQIVSDAMGKEKIHYEAPPSAKVEMEMTNFIQWFNATAPDGYNPIKQPIIRAAIAHLYFESIHPFEDGNGRIGRAISEKALSQNIQRPILLSLSKSIEQHKNHYYDTLQLAQRSNEITPWITYFVKTVLDAQIQAEEEIEFTLKKTKFFDVNLTALNERQLKVIKRMLEEGPKGFEGGMNARKYVGIVGTSKATATRDLQDLVEKNILVPVGAGRSARYLLPL